jgi:hypothetical protein
VDSQTYERKLVERLRVLLPTRSKPAEKPTYKWDLVTIESISVERKPRPQVVILFKSEERPGCRFGLRTSAHGGMEPELIAELIATNLEEQVEARS